ncbi:MAG: hypothetical protein E6R03_17130 [Hyphomicrobiaceae bacterium]|nr:MAG: hypothetical protein E6R03_17130 [Hyphomicrobiaceae bacterium]
MTAEIVSIAAARSARAARKKPAAPVALRMGGTATWEASGRVWSGKIVSLYLDTSGHVRAVVEDEKRQQHFVRAEAIRSCEGGTQSGMDARSVPVAPARPVSVRDPALAREIRAELTQLREDLIVLGGMQVRGEITLEQFYRDEADRAFEAIDRIARITAWQEKNAAQGAHPPGSGPDKPAA